MPLTVSCATSISRKHGRIDLSVVPQGPGLQAYTGGMPGFAGFVRKKEEEPVMSMTNPTILQLLEKADCRYTLVVEVSKRARQLVDGIPPLIDAKDKENMPVSIAIDEVNRGLIAYERTAESDAR